MQNKTRNEKIIQWELRSWSLLLLLLLSSSLSIILFFNEQFQKTIFFIMFVCYCSFLKFVYLLHTINKNGTSTWPVTSVSLEPSQPGTHLPTQQISPLPSLTLSLSVCLSLHRVSAALNHHYYPTFYEKKGHACYTPAQQPHLKKRKRREEENKYVYNQLKSRQAGWQVPDSPLSSTQQQQCYHYSLLLLC